MKTTDRPLAVLILSCLYMAVGAIGFAAHFHFHELMTLQQDSLWIEPTELLAVIAGIFMLCGCNWARWLALVWMAFHVAISFPAARQVVTHSIIFALIAWVLFRPDTRRYFKPLKTVYE